MTDESPKASDWTIFRCGVAGVCVLSAAVGIKLLANLPRLFTEPWTWGEFLALPFQVVVLGFLTGAAHGVVLPLARLGRLGDALIGAVCGNVYLLVCFALFETEALLHPHLDAAAAFAAIATLLGSALGLAIGNELRKPP